MPENKAIRDAFLHEAHESAYSIHPGSTKMYLDKNPGWVTDGYGNDDFPYDVELPRET